MRVFAKHEKKSSFKTWWKWPHLTDRECIALFLDATTLTKHFHQFHSENFVSEK